MPILNRYISPSKKKLSQTRAKNSSLSEKQLLYTDKNQLTTNNFELISKALKCAATNGRFFSIK